MRWAGSVIAASVLVAAVCSCSTPPAPGLTYEQELAILDDEQGFDWKRTRLDDTLRPAHLVVSPTTEAAQAEILLECLNEAGISTYEISRGQLVQKAIQSSLGAAATYEEMVAEQAVRDRETLAYFTCTHMYPTLPSARAMLTDDQLRYIYDYYLTELVPCLTDHGFALTYAPTFDSFAPAGQHQMTWNPYFSVSPPAVTTLAECAPMPTGFEYALFGF
jgi:hypothetical protein